MTTERIQTIHTDLMLTKKTSAIEQMQKNPGLRQAWNDLQAAKTAMNNAKRLALISVEEQYAEQIAAAEDAYYLLLKLMV